VAGAATHPALETFLVFVIALVQAAALPALGLYRCWYGR
jgi:hypothetical protein